MKWIKGIVLLLISNLLFMVAINVIVSFVLPAFGVTLGGDTLSLLTMAGIYGFTGAFLSLAFSKQMARSGGGIGISGAVQREMLKLQGLEG